MVIRFVPLRISIPSGYVKAIKRLVVKHTSPSEGGHDNTFPLTRKDTDVYRYFIITLMTLLSAGVTTLSLAATTVEWVADNSHAGLTKASAQPIVNEAKKAGSRHGVDPVLILAVMRAETGYRQNAVSTEGAMCMMQVIPRWHRDKIGKRSLKDFATCVDVGARVLKEYLGLCGGSSRCALVKYSGGSWRYASSVLAWRAEIVMATGDGGHLLAALTEK